MTRSDCTAARGAGRPRSAWLLAVALLVASGCDGEVPPPPEEAPPPRPPGVTVTGAPAPPGSELRVFADGFAPLASVEIGFGMPDSEYDVVARSRTDADGTLALMLTVPEWAMVGQRYVVVVAGPDRRRRAVSESFVVE